MSDGALAHVMSLIRQLIVWRTRQLSPASSEAVTPMEEAGSCFLCCRLHTLLGAQTSLFAVSRGAMDIIPDCCLLALRSNSVSFLERGVTFSCRICVCEYILDRV